jgi:hypothetical protein
MPNRAELSILAMQKKTGMILPGVEAWTVIGFCAAGWLASFFLAISSIGAEAYSGMAQQILG